MTSIAIALLAYVAIHVPTRVVAIRRNLRREGLRLRRSRITGQPLEYPVTAWGVYWPLVPGLLELVFFLHAIDRFNAWLDTIDEWAARQVERQAERMDDREGEGK